MLRADSPATALLAAMLRQKSFGFLHNVCKPLIKSVCKLKKTTFEVRKFI